MKRTSCSACGSTHLEMFLDLGLSPVADAYTNTPHDPVNKFALELAVCGECRLVQLLEVLSDQFLFGTGYSFYSSASPPLSAYHAAYAQDVLTNHAELADSLVIEVGCNDGDLLRHFSREHYAIGIDPAEGPVEVARERGLQVRNEALTAELGFEIAGTFGTAGIVIANHVLAHVADVNDFLQGLAHMAGRNGIVMIEVQYLPDLFVNNAFDLVYHEHRNFFSLTSLEQAARRVGLNVVDAELTSRQGGSLRVTLSKRPAESVASTSRVRTILHSEQWLQDWGPYAGFQGRVERIKTRLLELIWAEQKRGYVVGFGAPAKATTLLNFCGIDDTMLMYVIDSTPAKQGRFIPGTGLQILDPARDDEPADTYLLLSWNYAPEIMRGNRSFTMGEGRWIIPIPAPMML